MPTLKKIETADVFANSVVYYTKIRATMTLWPFIYILDSRYSINNDWYRYEKVSEARSLVFGIGSVDGGLVGGCGVSGSWVRWGFVSWGGVREGFVCRSGVRWSGVRGGGVRGSLVDWGLVRRCFVFLGFDVFGVFGLSLVFHISGVSVLISAVGDDLGAAVGESNAVRSSGYFLIGLLGVVKVGVSLSILYVVAEAVRLGSLFFSF